MIYIVCVSFRPCHIVSIFLSNCLGEWCYCGVFVGFEQGARYLDDLGAILAKWTLHWGLFEQSPLLSDMEKSYSREKEIDGVMCCGCTDEPQ